MEITLTTPALLFPAVSLLRVSYTNRLPALGFSIRVLHAQYKSTPDTVLSNQIVILQKRGIRNRQFLGVASLFLCIPCMFLLFGGKLPAGKIISAVSLLFYAGFSGHLAAGIPDFMQALNLELNDMGN
jgi:hypothetical protein